MKRRDFLKAAAASSLAVLSPWPRRRARAAEPYNGPLWVMVNAEGGWDPTAVCDPKGRANEEVEDPVNLYLTNEIGQAGNIRYAPIPGNQEFFEKYQDDLVVINGIDTQTDVHAAGRRHVWSGGLAAGRPGLAALVAGALAPGRPMAFMTTGGYDETANLVARTRIGSMGVFQRLAHPNRIDVNDPESFYHNDSTWDRIRATQAARLQEVRDKQGLPTARRAMGELFLARTDPELDGIIEHLPEELDSSNNPLRRQAQVAIAAYKADLAVGASLSLGGFDTHSGHDGNHYPRVQMLLEGVDFILMEALRQGVRDDIVVVVGSDFGRAPRYNDHNGKDHWSITSMMVVGWRVSGGRVVGSTDEGLRPVPVNRSSLAPDSSGALLTPAHVHRALRTLAGLGDHELAARYPLGGEDLPILF